MSKVIVFSDLHLHNYRDFAHTLDNGRNSRLQRGLDVLSSIRKYAKAHDIRDVLFGGDLLHKKGIIPVPLYHALYEEVERYNDDLLHLVLLVGNHDQASADGTTHSVAALGRVAQVIDTPRLISLSDNQTTVRCVPYMDDQEEFLRAITDSVKANLLLAHGAINGAVTGPVEYQPDHPLNPDDLPDYYDFMFFGHYHKRQQMRPKCWFIGSPMQHSRGEREEHDKGFLVYDTDTRKFKNVPLGMPEFKSFVFALHQPQKDEVEGHYIDVEVDPDTYNLDEVRAGLIKMGAEAVNIVPVTKEKKTKQRLDVDLSMDLRSLVKKYVEEYAEEGTEKELTKRALKYLEGA